MTSGVPILDALEIVAKTAGNVVIEAGLMTTRTKISEGQNMAEPLMATNIFPPMVVQMVGVGEQTGALDQMLNKIADFYEDEVDAAVSGLTSLIEPIMMVGIGGTACNGSLRSGLSSSHSSSLFLRRSFSAADLLSTP